MAPDSSRYALDILDHRINYRQLKDRTRQPDSQASVAVDDEDLDFGSLISATMFYRVYVAEYEPGEDALHGVRRSPVPLDRVAPGNRRSRDRALLVAGRGVE